MNGGISCERHSSIWRLRVALGFLPDALLATYIDGALGGQEYQQVGFIKTS